MGGIKSILSEKGPSVEGARCVLETEINEEKLLRFNFDGCRPPPWLGMNEPCEFSTLFLCLNTLLQELEVISNNDSLKWIFLTPVMHSQCQIAEIQNSQAFSTLIYSLRT